MQESRSDCDNLSALLAQISRFIHQHARQMLHELGLQRGQPHILSFLWHEEGLTQTQLAERVMISPPSMSHALQRLEDARYVERRPDPKDDRMQRVYLTEAGRALQAPLDEGWREVERRAFAGLTEQERDTLRRLLERVRDNLAPSPCQQPCHSADTSPSNQTMPSSHHHH